MQESSTFSNERIGGRAAKRIDIDPFSVAWTNWHTGAAIGLVGAVLAMLAGLALVIIAWAEGGDFNNSLFGTTGTWLMVAMFPLLMLGGHCLDKVVEVGRTQRAILKKQKLARLTNS